MIQHRHSPYNMPHQAQRHLLGVTTTAIGSLDVDDDDEVLAVCEAVRRLTERIESHCRYEQKYVHPLIAQAAPDIIERLEREHIEISILFEALRHRVGALESAQLNERADMARELYRDFALVTARYYEHIDVEERQAAPLMLAAHDAATIAAVEQSVMHDEGFPTMQMIVANALPVLAPTDRIELLSMFGDAFPNEATPDILFELATPTLGEGALSRLRADLDTASS